MISQDTNGWREYKRLVLHEIKQLRKEGIRREERLLNSFEKLEDSFNTVKDTVKEDTDANAKDIVTLKIKAARWGATAGVSGAVLIKVIEMLSST